MKKAIAIVICLSFLTGGCATSRVKKLNEKVDELDARMSRVEQAEGISGDVTMSGTVTLVSDKAQSSSVSMQSVSMSKKEIQRALQKAGYYQGAIDGKLGQMSRKAIEEFQRDHGLKVDGVAGQQTQKELIKYL